MNIAIVDDSAEDRALLVGAIKKYAKENTLLVRLKEYENGELFSQKESFAMLDVVFLDIYMGELNGMEVAHKIRQVNSTCQLVFVSSSGAFAVESYAVRAFYYLVKPYFYESIANVLNMLDQSLANSSRYIKVKEGREWRKIFLCDILYVDYSNHYVQIHTENSITSTYMNFPEMEKKLLGYSEFSNCYRCIVINMSKIKKVEDLFFLLCNGEYIPINRKRAKEIKGHYMDYIFGELEGD